MLMNSNKKLIGYCNPYIRIWAIVKVHEKGETKTEYTQYDIYCIIGSQVMRLRAIAAVLYSLY